MIWEELTRWAATISSIPGDDIVVRLAFFSGGGAIITSGLVTATLLLVQRRRSRRDQRWLRLRKEWMRILVSTKQPLPDLSKHDIPSFLELWTRVAEGIRGSFRKEMAEVARQSNMLPKLRKLGAKGRLGERIRAIHAIGLLQDLESWDLCEDLLESNSPHLSQSAGLALARIDPQKAAKILLRFLSQKEEWPSAWGVRLLSECGSAVASEAFVTFLSMPNPYLPRRIWQLLPALGHVDADAIAAKWLPKVDGVSASTLLANLHSPENIQLALDRLNHPAMPVRLEACKVIGRIGSSEHLPVLFPSLCDRDWWVRYRSAQAIVEICRNTPARLQSLKDELVDRFAVDMLHMVMSEEGLAWD